MDNKKKYEDMLMKLAAEFPELEQEAMGLHMSIMDLDAPDVAEDKETMDEEMGPEIEISIEDGEEEEMPMPMKKGKKMPIPAELMDMEEDEEDKK